MNIEEQLITKTYYRSLIEENSEAHPVRLLGELFIEEEKKEIPDASYIRFSQGEVYFHNKDYEAAIFKWENVHNELEQWAKKNIADAYMELELYVNAEDIYKSIQSDSLVLNTEVLLQLFSLYLEINNAKKADQTIKQAVFINPDYPNVTKLARNFFEQRKDWDSALNLAVQEAVRTENTMWLEIIKNYIRNGHAKSVSPVYFYDALTVANKLASDLFEGLLNAIWDDYFADKIVPIQTLSHFNSYLKGLEFDPSYQWRELPYKYKEAYTVLMDGTFSMSELKKMVPDFLEVWLKIAGENDEVYPSSAIFAWNEIIPESISKDALTLAEQKLFQSQFDIDVLSRSVELNESIEKWSENHNLKKDARLQFVGEQMLDKNSQYVGVISFYSESKTKFINHFLNEEVLENGKTAVNCIFKYGEKLSVKQYEREGSEVIFDGDIYHSSLDMGSHLPDTVVDISLPNLLLNQYKLALINLPDLSFEPELTKEMTDTLQLPDTLFFVLDEASGLTDIEYRWAQLIEKEYPKTSIYYIINSDGNSRDGNITDIYYKLNTAMQNGDMSGTIFNYEQREDDRHRLARLLYSEWKEKDLKNSRVLNYLTILKRIIDGIFAQRTNIENQLTENISWDDDIAKRAKGAIHQLEDLNIEKIQMIQKSFALVKEETKKDIISEIPKILKETADSITKNRDFNKIHIHLNNEMNDRIQTYLNQQLIPEFLTRINDWLSIAEAELNNSKLFLDEMADGFNSMIGVDRLLLECDFKVLEDWQRDIDRFTSKVYYNPVNILLRHTPQQILLKGTGKVLNKLTNNKEKIAIRYKQFIENENYQDVAESVAKDFLNPYELLEQGISRDVNIFFKGAFAELKNLVLETELDAKEKREELTHLRENPEAFRDPLNIFEITRLQYKYIIEVEEMNVVEQTR